MPPLPELARRVWFDAFRRSAVTELNEDLADTRFMFEKGEREWYVCIYVDGRLRVKVPVKPDSLPAKLHALDRELSANVGDVIEFVGVNRYTWRVHLELHPETPENRIGVWNRLKRLWTRWC